MAIAAEYPRRGRIPRILFLGAASLLAVTVIAAILAMSRGTVSDRAPAWLPVPAEDAYILYRYSDHLSNEQGITWNVGEEPVELHSLDAAIRRQLAGAVLATPRCIV